MQSVLALVGGILAAHKVLGNFQLSPNPSIIFTGVLHGSNLGNRIAVIALAGNKCLVLSKNFQAILALLLLDQVDLHVANGEGVGLIIGVGEIRHGGAGDGHNHQDSGQAQGYDLLLSHDSFFLSFMYFNKLGKQRGD